MGRVVELLVGLNAAAGLIVVGAAYFGGKKGFRKMKQWGGFGSEKGVDKTTEM